jgi:ketosteroid isomerase-like protein
MTSPNDSLPAADDAAIRRLVVAYADAVSRLDPDAWAATWAEGARWELGARVLEGRAAIVAHWTALLPIYESVLQLPTQGWLAERGDEVVGRWLVLEILRKREASEDALQVACYVDRYVREGGNWVFATRRLSAHYRGSLGSGAFVPLPPLP